MPLHIIHTETGLLLSKRAYPSWRAIQDAYPDYKASLGPWDADEVIDYLADEYPDIAPSAAEQVTSFLASPDEAVAIAFRQHAP